MDRKTAAQNREEIRSMASRLEKRWGLDGAISLATSSCDAQPESRDYWGGVISELTERRDIARGAPADPFQGLV